MSASIPLLDLAQRQVGAETNTQGWLPIPVMEFVAKRARHAATSACSRSRPSTPCSTWRRSAASTSRCAGRRRACCAARTTCSTACAKRGLKKGHTTDDGLFTLTEVECLGACANAPMVQINDDNYEDLTEESMGAILDALAARRDAQARPAGRPPDELPRRRPDHAQEDGRAQLRLSPAMDGDGRGGRAMIGLIIAVDHRHPAHRRCVLKLAEDRDHPRARASASSCSRRTSSGRSGSNDDPRHHRRRRARVPRLPVRRRA